MAALSQLLLPGPVLLADLIDDPAELEQPVTPKKAPQKPVRPAPEPPSADSGKKAPATKPTKASPPAKTEPRQKRKSGPDERNLPIHLKSEGQSTYSRNGRLIHLVKNVKISQGSLRFRADEARVFLAPEDSTEESVEKVEIDGNVRVFKNHVNPAEKMKASGDKALFFNSRRKVVLVGNARLWQGGQLIKGKQITYDLETTLITVDRAESVLHSDAVRKKPAGGSAKPTRKPADGS